MSKKHLRYTIALLLAAAMLLGLGVTAVAAEGGGDPEPGITTEPTGEPTPTPTPEPAPETTPETTAEATPTPTPVVTVPPATAAPVITADLPGTIAVLEGMSFDLSVGASGDNLQYQWYKDGSPLSGQTGPSYRVTGAGAANAGRYYCYVQNSAGAVESSGCVVKIISQPVITQDITPTALTLNAGDTITLTAAASGENMAIHWFYKKGETDIREIPGQNGTTLSITAAEEHNGADFYCQFVNEAGGAITSFCHVTVNKGTAPQITKNPVGETVNERGSAIFIARADGATSYTWRFISTGGAVYDYDKLGNMFPGLNVSGGDTESLSLSNIPYELSGWKVACLFRNVAGETLSSAAGIQVQRASAGVSITSQPRGATMAMDEDMDFTLSVQASSANGGTFSYQWYSASTNSAAAMKSIPGATESTYQPPRAEGTTYYRVSVTVTSGGVTSEPVYSATVPVSFTTKKDHEHTYSSVWEHNDLSHWHQCTCGDHADEALHTYQWTVLMNPTETADGQQKGVCTVCGYETVQPIPAGSMPAATEAPAPAAPERSGGHAGIYILLAVLALIVIAAAVFLILRVLRAPEEDEPEEDFDSEEEETEEFDDADLEEEEEGEPRSFLRRWFRK